MTSPLAIDLKRLAALGHTAKEAAALAGCSWGVARTVAAREHFRFTHESERRAARVVELARAGRTATEIAAEVGICRHNVYRILARQPEAPRPATQAQRLREARAKVAEAEEVARMARWRDAWASRKAAEVPPQEATAVMDEATLGDAMRRLAEAERGRRLPYA